MLDERARCRLEAAQIATLSSKGSAPGVEASRRLRGVLVRRFRAGVSRLAVTSSSRTGPGGRGSVVGPLGS